MNEQISANNSVKCVISCFAERVLRDIDQIDSYKLLGICGVGSNGIVFRVIHVTTKRIYALKLINVLYFISDMFSLDICHIHESCYSKYPQIIQWIKSVVFSVFTRSAVVPKHFSTESAYKSFYREYTALSCLQNNERTVSLVDYGVVFLNASYTEYNQKEIPYFVMPYYDGINLTRVVEDSNFSTKCAVSILMNIVEIVESIHECGVIHRDLYPNNFIYNRISNSIYLVDFGSAIVNNDFTLDMLGERRGARRFMSPEQFRSPQDCGFITDYYFFGGILYYLLTKDTPYSRDRGLYTLPHPMYIPPLEFDICELAKVEIFKFVDSVLEYDVSQRLVNINDIKEEITKIQSLLL